MSSVSTSSAGGSFASVSFAITADGTVYLNALAMCEQRTSTTVDNITKNYDKVNKEVDKFGDRCYDTFNSVANALEKSFGIAKNVISGLMNSFADYGDTIAKMSQRTGIAAQSLSEFDYIAGQCGTSLDTFETAIKQMEKTLAGAASGAADAQKKLANIGSLCMTSSENHRISSFGQSPRRSPPFQTLPSVPPRLEQPGRS